MSVLKLIEAYLAKLMGIPSSPVNKVTMVSYNHEARIGREGMIALFAIQAAIRAEERANYALSREDWMRVRDSHLDRLRAEYDEMSMIRVTIGEGD